MDGLAGSGKSTTARILAGEDIPTLEVGALYRRVAARLLDHGPAALYSTDMERVMHDATISNGTDGVIDVQVDHLITVTQDARVRSLVTCYQIQWAARHAQSIVVGRVGGCIFPNAELKVFLTVSPEEQAKRLGDNEAHLRDARLRNQADTHRLHNPAKPSPGALQIDTSRLTPQAVVLIIDRILEGNLEVWPS